MVVLANFIFSYFRVYKYNTLLFLISKIIIIKYLLLFLPIISSLLELLVLLTGLLETGYTKIHSQNYQACGILISSQLEFKYKSLLLRRLSMCN